MEREDNPYCMLDGNVHRPLHMGDGMVRKRSHYVYRAALLAFALHVVIAWLVWM